MVDIKWADIVFLDKNGKPISLSKMNSALYKICNYAEFTKYQCIYFGILLLHDVTKVECHQKLYR